MSSTFWASIALRSRRSVVWSSSERKVSISPKTEAVSASVSGVEAISAPCGAGQHLVHAMAELVRQRHHVARLAHVVEQHVGMRRRHRRMREGARRLAGPHRRVDPVAVEEVRGDSAISGEKRSIGREHGVLRLVPADRSPAASRAAARCGPNG